MKRMSCAGMSLIVAALCFLSLFLPLEAANAQVVNKASADDFIENGVLGGQVVATGGVALFADDASLVMHNPARLATQEYPSLLLSRATIFTEASYSYLLYSQRINPKWGGFGVGLVQMTADEFVRRDSAGNALGSFDVGDRALVVSYGYPVPWVKNLSVGFSYRMLEKTVDTYSAEAADLTLSAHYRRWDHWDFYLAAENFMGASLDLNPQNAYDDELPRRLHYGAMYSGIWKDRVRVGAEMVSIPDQDSRINLGVDLRMFDHFWLGAGLNNQENLSAGFKAGYNDFTFTYAFRNNTDLEESVHLFELGWHPGVTKSAQDTRYREYIAQGLSQLAETTSDTSAYDRAIASFQKAKEVADYPEAQILIEQVEVQRKEEQRLISERQQRNEQAYQRGQERILAGEYLAAIEILGRVEEGSDYYASAQEQIRRAQDTLERRQMREESEDRVQLAQQAFLNGDPVQALAFAEIVLRDDPDNQQMIRLRKTALQMIESTAAAEAQAEQQANLIKTYSEAMEQAWRAEDYEAAAVHAENLLTYAPNNERAVYIKREAGRLAELWAAYNSASDAYLRKDWSAAANHLERARGIPDETWQALHDRVEAARLQEERRQLLRQTMKEKRELALRYFAEQEYAKALNELGELLSMNLEEEDRALVYSDYQRVRNAIEQVQAIPQEERPKPPAAPTRPTEERRQRVQEQERRLRETNQELIQNYLRNGIRAEASGRKEEALNWYRRILDLDPNNATALSRINKLVLE